MRIRLLAALCLLPVLAACSSGSDSGDDVGAEDRDIAFTTSVSETRGTLTTLSNMGDYGVSCAVYPSTGSYASAACGSYFYNQKMSSSATGYDSGYMWPGSQYRLSFYAYAPYGNNNLTISSVGTVGRPKYTYNAPQDITNHIDFMTAEITDRDGTATDTPVKLTFTHRLAGLKFSIINSSSAEITFNSLTVCGVKYKGTLDGDVWTLEGEANTSTTSPFTLSAASLQIAAGATTDISGSDKVMFLPPQTVAPGTDFLIVNVTVNGANLTYTYTTPSNINLTEGTVSVFKIEVNDETIYVNAVNAEIPDWEPENP